MQIATMTSLEFFLYDSTVPTKKDPFFGYVFVTLHKESANDTDYRLQFSPKSESPSSLTFYIKQKVLELYSTQINVTLLKTFSASYTTKDCVPFDILNDREVISEGSSGEGKRYPILRFAGVNRTLNILRFLGTTPRRNVTFGKVPIPDSLASKIETVSSHTKNELMTLFSPLASASSLFSASALPETDIADIDFKTDMGHYMMPFSYPHQITNSSAYPNELTIFSSNIDSLSVYVSDSASDTAGAGISSSFVVPKEKGKWKGKGKGKEEEKGIPSFIAIQLLELALLTKAECPITAEPFQKGETSVMPCGHLFSSSALAESFKLNPEQCPSCRSSGVPTHV